MGEYTKGQWREDGRFISACGQTDTYAGPVWGTIMEAKPLIKTDSEGRTWTAHGTPEENAHRAASCVRALEGIDDPEQAVRDLMEALEPFTDARIRTTRATEWAEENEPWPDDKPLFGYEDWILTVGMIRRARKALEPFKEIDK